MLKCTLEKLRKLKHRRSNTGTSFALPEETTYIGYIQMKISTVLMLYGVLYLFGSHSMLTAMSGFTHPTRFQLSSEWRPHEKGLFLKRFGKFRFEFVDSESTFDFLGDLWLRLDFGSRLSVREHGT